MLLCLAILAWLTTPAPPPETLRVMTFNIHAGHGDLARVAAVIREAAPDVAALQEVDVHWGERSGFVDQAAALAAATGMDVRFGPIYRMPGAAPGDPMREFGVAILSRLPIAASRNHAITRLSTQDSRGAEPMPGFLEVTVRTPRGEADIFATHLDYRADATVRRVQVTEMLAITRARRHPVILMGDLNAAPAALELQPLFRRFRDAAPSAGSATYPADAPAKRIDYVLVTPGLRILRSAVIRTDASDHLPVLADVAIP